MGYYTNYNFSDNSPEVIEAINLISGYSYEDSSQTEYYDVKWYDWREHVKEVSQKFPDELIKIEGEGEESGDIWRAYYKNGKSVQLHVEMTHPDFDERMLK